ncbi:anti-repressor SinI family protein [Niallia endozanthoxylica]|uniref:DNA-binding anti-repressor SinI n=1 Tax=Niallia endozanthoxylica TaxID=2036016 RepID=A0A5J5I6F4_9BACI|nr:anti-repressor SinI family protein [Niallia endozanthoxylica]KAA9031192.1 DNA-binding anti-repressor SinI [Niallia endozanthoxylica]
MSEGKEQNTKYDIEWIQLMTEAKSLGIDIEEIRDFLHNQIHR